MEAKVISWKEARYGLVAIAGGEIIGIVSYIAGRGNGSKGYAVWNGDEYERFMPHLDELQIAKTRALILGVLPH